MIFNFLYCAIVVSHKLIIFSKISEHFQTRFSHQYSRVACTDTVGGKFKAWLRINAAHKHATKSQIIELGSFKTIGHNIASVQFFL